ncbi:hypothetical protein Btru_046090 [Bulinus truncatus]|nr:hypothetical protein Btru_046090 [Bulinus truncatus]
MAAASLVNVADSGDGTQRRYKRHVVQLCDMIDVYTPRHCTAYAAYGCFCGFRSWGSNPVDGSDRCCRQHDQCYANVGCTGLPWMTYSYRCSGSSCTCTDSNLSSCEYRSCQCDVQFAQCLRTASWSFRYLFHDESQCQ